MKKICLTVIGLYIGLLATFSQQVKPADTSNYQSRKLNIEEINFVSSYYHQDGNNAAVTGGIGSQKLDDFSNYLELKLRWYDRKQRLNKVSGDIGIDYYTSASSDKIDPKTISSASYSDVRVYPSVGWSRENEVKGTEFGIGLSTSTEFDYQSFGINGHYSRKTKNRMGEFAAKGQVYFDQLSLIYPVELRSGQSSGEGGYSTDVRNSFSLNLSWSQIVNQRLQLMFLLDLIQQSGYLSLPFNRVYFSDASVQVEKLPGSRFKLPIGFRANYFMGDKVILRGFYRYYHDDWGLEAHTINIETAIKINPFFSISPFYRFYHQSAVNYFKPYQEHTAEDEYYTSNYDVSKFTSHYFGAGIRIAPPGGVFGIDHFNSVEIRYGHYTRENNFNSNIVSLHLKYK
ncbi:DUF3570 domain-containing protein [Flavihumibacter fluvii]|uniref:DUF3570 domain-containing protein n=1 Tax=Flavihumibacter fluvii TaxID=2838157 RepID=UPI001BDDDDFC|nr:DUF3570 domain-containing protein [Flavihumibacter fluvii]ULQ51619.1 DUF3570 domain-containing protein [Flavihumibacter fluvii]